MIFPVPGFAFGDPFDGGGHAGLAGFLAFGFGDPFEVFSFGGRREFFEVLLGGLVFVQELLKIGGDGEWGLAGFLLGDLDPLVVEVLCSLDEGQNFRVGWQVADAGDFGRDSRATGGSPSHRFLPRLVGLFIRK